MSILHGRNIIVRAGTGSSITAVALQKSCELDRDCEMREKASQDGTNREYSPGLKGWTLSVSGLASTVDHPLSVGELYSIEIAGGGETLSGTAYCSQTKVTGVIGNLAQQSAHFQGTGPLGDGTVNPST